MSWYIAGAAAISIGTAVFSSQNNSGNQVKAANTQSKAEGDAVVKERLNQTIRNSYSTSMAQMQLALQKRQLSQQGVDINAAKLASLGDAAVVTAATGSIGATTDAVVSDINQKANAALDQTRDAFENAVENYNLSLEDMVISTKENTTAARAIQYNGPSNRSVIAGAVAQGASQFASSYAMRKMNLGLGTNTQPTSTASIPQPSYLNSPSTLSYDSTSSLNFNSSSTSAWGTGSLF